MGMNSSEIVRLSAQYPLGHLVAEGKTKKIYRVLDNPKLVVVTSQDDITAGDGAKHDVIPGKGRLANETTCNVFRLLKDCGLPVAFVEQDSTNSFIAQQCRMFKYEVVVRREAHGSYVDRNPHVPKGHLFPKLILEFFLKTSGKLWNVVKDGLTYPLVKDDPLMAFDYAKEQVSLYYPGYTSDERKTAAPGALVGQKPFLTLEFDEIFTKENERKLIKEMGDIARKVFLVLERAWQIEGRKLVDFKVEFGLDSEGHLLLVLADVIDNDSWRVVENGAYIDKQVYRDGGTLSDIAAKFARVAEITSRFQLPRQRIIIWCGSVKDDSCVFKDAVGTDTFFRITRVTCSVHKEPIRAAEILQRLLQEVPDSVVIAYVGRSNGAGPMLSAMSTVPVITVPASIKEFPDDVWSSLRVPSNVPVMTVFETANAMLAALNILSARNPGIYAILRTAVEERLVNTVSI